MNTRFSLVSTFLVLASIALGGCAGDTEPGDEEAAPVVVAPSEEGSVTPQMQGYVPRVTREDIRSGGGSCAGNLCTINSTMWNCTGGGYCSIIRGY